VEDEPRGAASEPHPEQPPGTKSESRPGRSHRSFLPDVTDVDFSIARRGYDRMQVDRYVERVSRVVVELEASRSPDAVIERALADVGEETSAILRRARHAAEEIIAQAESEAQQTAARGDADAQRTREAAERFSDKVRRDANELLAQARSEATQITARAEAEAQRTREDADGYHRQVIAHTEQLAQQRHGLIEDLRKLADTFHHTADRALEQVPEAPQERADGDGDSLGASR
jgi:DivIVA domain-containing protein